MRTLATTGSDDTFWGLSASEWSAGAAVITAATAVVAAIYAWWQWRDARRAQREATRPYVVVVFEPSAATRQVTDLVVRNSGQRPALDVCVALDPPPERSNEGTEGSPLSEVKMLSEQIGMLAPGQELRTTFDAIPRRLKTDLPWQYRATVTYRDSTNHQFTEAASLDLEAERGARHVVTYGTHDAAKAMREIEKILAKSSLLAPQGSIDTDTAIETRDDRLQRLNDEAARLQANFEDMKTLFERRPKEDR